jgi:hypothetical protein
MIGVHGHTVKRLNREGQLAGEYVDGEFRTTPSAVESCKQRLAAELAKAPHREIDEALRNYNELIGRFHRLRIQVEVELNALEADARELECHGDSEGARAVRDLRDSLRVARYQWEPASQSWRITLDDGSSALTQSTEAFAP